MKLTEKQQRAQNLLNSIITEAWKNESFKQRLLVDPKNEIEKFTGKSLGDITIIAVDQTNPDYVYLNIPSKIDLADIELSDEQLEIVSGGEVGVALTLAAAVGVYAYYKYS